MYLGGPKVIGRITYMVQWKPPSVGVQCFHEGHVGCSLTGNIPVEAYGIEGPTEDSLMEWVCDGILHDDADSHRAARPPHTHEKRR